MIQHDMKLSDPVLTFRLLDGANILKDEKKLVLTFCVDLKYEKNEICTKTIFCIVIININAKYNQ